VVGSAVGGLAVGLFVREPARRSLGTRPTRRGMRVLTAPSTSRLMARCRTYRTMNDSTTISVTLNDVETIVSAERETKSLLVSW
jgi:hypothetical protein